MRKFRGANALGGPSVVWIFKFINNSLVNSRLNNAGIARLTASRGRAANGIFRFSTIVRLRARSKSACAGAIDTLAGRFRVPPAGLIKYASEGINIQLQVNTLDWPDRYPNARSSGGKSRTKPGKGWLGGGFWIESGEEELVS